MAHRDQGYRRERLQGTRRFGRRVVIAAEGAVSEQEYFYIAKSKDSVVQVFCVPGSGDPKKVLRRMNKYLQQNPLDIEDQAWLVTDKDSWTDTQLRALHDWTKKDKRKRFHFALSNPKFEYWLLLHFEDSHGITNASEVDTRLKRYLPHFDKHIKDRDFSEERITAATQRAKNRDRPPSPDWPRAVGTTVYRIIEAIRSGNQPQPPNPIP